MDSSTVRKEYRTQAEGTQETTKLPTECLLLVNEYCIDTLDSPVKLRKKLFTFRTKCPFSLTIIILIRTMQKPIIFHDKTSLLRVFSSRASFSAAATSRSSSRWGIPRVACPRSLAHSTSRCLFFSLSPKSILTHPLACSTLKRSFQQKDAHRSCQS